MKRNRGLRILIVAPYPIFPMWSGGKVRILKLARALAESGHETTVLTPFHPAQKSILYRHEVFGIRQIPYPFLLPLLFTNRPFPYLYLTSFHPGLTALLRSFFRNVDVIHFEHMTFANSLHFIPKGVMVGYGAHNVEYDYLRQECSDPRIAVIVGRRIFKLERKMVRACTHIFPVSLEDQKRLEELYGESSNKYTLLPNGISFVRPALETSAAMYLRFPGIEKFQRKAIYSGSDVTHNRLAVQYLLEEVAPKAPCVGFIIHGSCGYRFRQYSSAGNVFFDTRFDTFSEYATADTVGLNPVLTGGGTNLKLVHYLSHGLQVLSTPFGIRGYSDLAPYVRVCKREDFADALLDSHFIMPPEPDYLMRHYSWTHIAAQMAKAYEETLGG
jgi:glycosyltransferase involved in cell wall biosynthesis